MDEIFNYEQRQEDDFYFILGCSQHASEEQINAEYKVRALSCHPDKNPDDPASEEQFARLSRAKEVLSDPEKRRDYDKWRNSGIAMPYDLWKSRSHMKTSMHWGVKKEQIAIGDQMVPSSSISNPKKTDANKKSPIHQTPTMNFVHRETQPTPHWERDTSNPMLQKFRNYQI